MGGDRPRYGKEYIIPSTFDPRLISVIPVAVAKAAIKSGVARKKIENFEIYKEQLKQRLRSFSRNNARYKFSNKKSPEKSCFCRW